MYCPNCKQEYEGKFCPECGTKMIEKPASKGGLNLNLGDANAISGGLNIDNSKSVSNVDNSVQNITNTTSTVNNITQVAAQKSEMEILQEKKNIYLSECKRAYEDNVLEQAEMIALEECRIKLGLDKVTADSILDSVRVLTERNARKTSLNPIAKTKLKILTDDLQKNEAQALMDQIDGLEALVNKYEHDELSRKYFLVLAALKPEKCIYLKESSKIDGYWKSFWSYLAYLKDGQNSKAENVLVGLDRFADYPEDNMTILAVAGALMTGKETEAKEFLEAVTGEFTPALQRFVDSLYLILDPVMAKEMSADANSCAFYLVNFFGQEDPKERACREKVAASNADKKVVNAEETTTECTIPYTFDDEEGTFTGIVIDGKPVKGSFISNSGDKFVGNWEEGKPYQGIYTSADGGTFEGTYKDGEPFNGIFMNFAIDGEGTVTARFEDGEICGFGTVTFPEGGYFNGEFKAGEPYNGMMTDVVFEDNGIMTARLVEGKANGYGTINFADGSKFEGELKDFEPYNGKMTGVVMDDGQIVDMKIVDGETVIDDDMILNLLEKAISDDESSSTVTDDFSINILDENVENEDDDNTNDKDTILAESKIKVLSQYLQDNNVSELLNEIDSIGAIIDKCDNEELYFMYFMILAVLTPQKCIETHDCYSINTYWDCFWTILAYAQITDSDENGQISRCVKSLKSFKNYPEENISVLCLAGCILQNEFDDNDKDELDGIADLYSPWLRRLVESICLLKDSLKAKDVGADESKCSFYLVNLFGQKDPKERALKEQKVQHVVDDKANANFKVKENRKVAAKEIHPKNETENEAKKVTYTVKITGITNQMLAMVTLRKLYGWDSSDSKTKFASIPFIIQEFSDKDSASELCEKLNQGGMICTVNAVNEIGEKVLKTEENKNSLDRMSDSLNESSDIALVSTICIKPSTIECTEAIEYVYGLNGKAIDFKKAIRFYKEAADKEDPRALFDYGTCLGCNWGTRLCAQKSQKMMESAYFKVLPKEEKNGDTESLLFVARCALQSMVSISNQSNPDEFEYSYWKSQAQHYSKAASDGGNVFAKAILYFLDPKAGSKWIDDFLNEIEQKVAKSPIHADALIFLYKKEVLSQRRTSVARKLFKRVVEEHLYSNDIQILFYLARLTSSDTHNDGVLSYYCDILT